MLHLNNQDASSSKLQLRQRQFCNSKVSLRTHLFSCFVPCHRCHDQFVSFISMIHQLLPHYIHFFCNCSYKFRIIMVTLYHAFSLLSNLNDTSMGFLVKKKKIIIFEYFLQKVDLEIQDVTKNKNMII